MKVYRGIDNPETRGGDFSPLHFYNDIFNMLSPPGFHVYTYKNCSGMGSIATQNEPGIRSDEGAMEKLYMTLDKLLGDPFTGEPVKEGKFK